MSTASAVRTLDHAPATTSSSAFAASRAVVIAGRVLFAAIFLMSGPNHFNSQTIQYAAHAGVPFAKLLVPASGVLAMIGALSIVTGYRARLGAWLLVAFLVPVTLSLHAFWAVTDPTMRLMQMAMFMKNVSMLGAALLITQQGAGRVSARSAGE
jgi:putative oxidoreductase